LHEVLTLNSVSRQREIIRDHSKQRNIKTVPGWIHKKVLIDFQVVVPIFSRRTLQLLRTRKIEPCPVLAIMASLLFSWPDAND
jgi:hypothetical protein